MTSRRQMNPTEAGRIYGKFTPSPVAVVRVRQLGGKIIQVHMNRKDRRRHLRRIQ